MVQKASKETVVNVLGKQVEISRIKNPVLQKVLSPENSRNFESGWQEYKDWDQWSDYNFKL